RFADYRGNQVRELGRLTLAELEDDLDPAAGQAMRLSRKVAKTAILLPSKQALYKLLTLPIMAAGDLHDALAFQIERQTPFSPDDVYFDYRVRERDTEAKRVSIELVVAPRTAVERAVNTARRLGFDPSTVGVGDINGGDPLAFNLLPRALTNRRRNFRPLLGLVVLGALLVGGWTVSRAALDHKTTRADALVERVELARQGADKLQALKDQRDALILESQFLGRRKLQAPKPIVFIEELTSTLPDHTWLFHLQQDGTRLRLSGYTSDASSLIELVGALPMFTDPKFGSPVTHDPRREKDRFNIVVELNTEPSETETEQ
ncbi:MAG: PilN domain-containing protein, partial [Alphaproteobacteria bacterium]|nr:PilN domain-containing protein [Alphaproteobacteria bacterium]